MVTDLVTDGDFSQIPTKVAVGDRLKPLIYRGLVVNLGILKRGPPSKKRTDPRQRVGHSKTKTTTSNSIQAPPRKEYDHRRIFFRSLAKTPSR